MPKLSEMISYDGQNEKLIIKMECSIIRAVKLGKYVNKQLIKHGIVRLWLVQLGTILVISTLCAVTYGVNPAISALLGGMVCFVPNVYFARRLFKYQGARSAKKIVNGFYRAEAIKIVLSMLLFTAVFVWVEITPLAFFVSYIMILMTHWFAPLIIVTKHNRPEK
jgi:ATP synthase protein I